MHGIDELVDVFMVTVRKLQEVVDASRAEPSTVQEWTVVGSYGCSESQSEGRRAPSRHPTEAHGDARSRDGSV
jgi:hypothetical protein